MEDLIENEEVQTIGEMLRNARVKQNKTIDEIAEELCIRKFYLNAIENMDFANTPPMPYCLGFVRSYAKLLGLNSDRIVASYKQVLTGEDEPHQQNVSGERVSSYPRLKHVVFGILGLALLAVAWSVLPTTSKFEDISEENTAVLPEPVIVAEEDEKKAEEPKVERKTVAEDAKEVKDEKKNDEKAKSATDEKKVKDAKEEKVKTDESKKEEEKKAEKAVLPQMKVVLTGPSWLELRKGNKILLNGIYNKGYKYDIPSEKGLVITVGRPRNVQFYLDDKLVTVATNIKRKNISLDSYLKTQD